MTGTRIGKYELVRRLGGGGMAEVFLARTIGVEGFARPVAIKRVLPSYSANPEFAKMFINEARISAGLRHANIVSTLDFDRDADGSLFLVMELVEGKDLDGLLETGPLPWAVTIHAVVEVLRGLGAAHDAVDERGRPLGIVHRDVSPHNVLVSWDGGVKVSDFGIAKAFQASNATHSGMLKGKASYISPEQINAAADLDGRSDLFAVGVMLHQMLTNERLFKGDSIEQVLTHAIRVASNLERLPWPNELRADVPPDLAEVTMRLLAVDRAQRFAHARDAMAALKRCRDASMDGQELLAQVVAQRFPADAPAPPMAFATPPGVATAQARPSGVAPIAGPQQPTFVTPSMQVAMQVDTRTAVLSPGQTPPGYAAASSAPMSAPRHLRRWLLAGVGVVAAAGIATIVAVSSSKGAGTNGSKDSVASGFTAPAHPTVTSSAPVAVPVSPVDARTAFAPMDPPADALRLPSGEPYVIIKPGHGPPPRSTDTIRAQERIQTPKGTVQDLPAWTSTLTDNDPWMVNALMLIGAGGEIVFWGSGNPRNAPVVFDVELEDITPAPASVDAGTPTPTTNAIGRGHARGHGGQPHSGSASGSNGSNGIQEIKLGGSQ